MYQHFYLNDKYLNDNYHGLIKLTEDIWNNIPIKSNRLNHSKSSWKNIQNSLSHYKCIFDNLNSGLCIAGGNLYSILFNNVRCIKKQIQCKP